MTPRGGLRTTPHAFHTCARFLPLPGYCVSRPGPGHARRTVRHRAASTCILSLHKPSDISRVSTLCSRVTWLHGPGATQDGWRDQRATSRNKPHRRGRRGEASRAPVAEKERLRRLSSPLLPPYDRVPLPLITRCLTHDKTAGHVNRNLTTGAEVTHHKVFCRLRLRAERRSSWPPRSVPTFACTSAARTPGRGPSVRSRAQASSCSAAALGHLAPSP